MTKDELDNIRPGDYIWYGDFWPRAPEFLFFVIARVGAKSLLTVVIKGTPRPGCMYEFPDDWSYSAYNILSRERFLAGEKPWMK